MLHYYLIWNLHARYSGSLSHDSLSHASAVRLMRNLQSSAWYDLPYDGRCVASQVFEALQQCGMHRSPYAQQLVASAAPATLPRPTNICSKP